MGASTSKQLTKFQDTLKNEIGMDADALANCTAVQNITINMKGTTDNCPVDFDNTCIATAQVDIQQMSEAIKNVSQQLAAENKNSDIVLGQASTSIQESETIITRINEITTECIATAEANANQDIEVNIENCKNTPIKLVNGGDAAANCMLAAVQNEILTFTQDSDAENSNEGVNLAEFAASGLMSLAPCVLCVIIVLAASSMGGKSTSNTAVIGQPK